MLIDIIRMPPVLGLPIDRRATVYVGEDVPANPTGPYVHWPTAPFVRRELHIGSLITQSPQNLFKAIHISQDSKWIFETVYAMEEATSGVCLYSKIISAKGSIIGISSSSVSYYRGDRFNKLVPISQFVSKENFYNSATQDIAILTKIHTAEDIVPPVFSDRDLWNTIDWSVMDDSFQYPKLPSVMVYKPLYDHVPQIFNALIDGVFWKPPHTEILGYHPNIDVAHDKWFNYEELSYSSMARGMSRIVNHPDFDDLVLDMLNLFATKISISSTLHDALHSITPSWTNRNFEDPYHPFFLGMETNAYYEKRLLTVFYEVTLVYCKIFKIDSEIFATNSYDNSSVTVSKNIYDEVSFTVHDIVHDRYISFYSTFPGLALATRSVGIYP